MSETKQIGRIEIIIDTENSYDHLGDVEAGFDENELERYIQRYDHYGISQLCQKLAYMQWQVWQAVRNKKSKEAIFDNGSVDCGL